MWPTPLIETLYHTQCDQLLSHAPTQTDTGLHVLAWILTFPNRHTRHCMVHIEEKHRRTHRQNRAVCVGSGTEASHIIPVHKFLHV